MSTASETCVSAANDRSAVSDVRSCSGLLDSGCRVLSVADTNESVDLPVSLPSGAQVTVTADGEWTYKAPASLSKLPPHQQAIDSFSCNVQTDAQTSRQIVTVKLRNRVGDLPSVETIPTGFLEDSSEPIRIFATANTGCDTKINLRPFSGHQSDSVPAVLVLEQPEHGTARTTDTGEIVFRPAAGFLGSTELRCLTENCHHSATFVVAHIDVQPR